MMLTLAEASEQAGISRSGLLKAIKRGKLSAVRDEVLGQWRIDSSELFRVYAPKSTPEQVKPTMLVNPEVLEERVRALERLVNTLEDERDDLRHRLDVEAEERRRLTHLLTYQPEKSLDSSRETPATPSGRLSLVEKLFGRNWKRGA